VSFPAVPAPPSVKIPVEVKLKRGWRFEPRRRLFENESGETFAPYPDLPKGTKIVYKVPRLAQADAAGLSDAERDLRRYLQVILPAGQSLQDHLAAIRSWPSVAEAQTGPVVSLPQPPVG
jgi:hypothetical protein